MARPSPPEDGSPARIIATMVGIVGILLLGSLAWSAVGALFSALGDATTVLTTGRPSATLTPQPGTSGSSQTVTTLQTATALQTVTTVAHGTAVAGVVEPTAAPPLATTATSPTPRTPPTPAASGRAPWLLLPLPAPDGRVPPGQLTVEARARGDAPITAIRLELDGAALAVSLEQRSEDTWRGSANAQVPAGRHTVRASVTDDQGRSGSFRWTFDAEP